MHTMISEREETNKVNPLVSLDSNLEAILKQQQQREGASSRIRWSFYVKEIEIGVQGS